MTLGAPRTPPFRQHYSAASCSPWFGLVQMAASPCMTSSRARYVRKSWTPSWERCQLLTTACFQPQPLASRQVHSSAVIAMHWQAETTGVGEVRRSSSLPSLLSVLTPSSLLHRNTVEQHVGVPFL